VAAGADLRSPWATPHTARAQFFYADSDQALQTLVETWFFGTAAPGGGNTYQETGAGGAVLAGIGPVARVSVPVAAGGSAMAGAGAVARVSVPVPSGNVVMAGVAAVAKAVSVVAAGGISLAGAAQAFRVAVASASGGFSLLGGAPAGLVFAPVCYGGVHASGTAAVIGGEPGYVGPVEVANPSIPAYSGGSVNTGAVFGQIGAKMGKLAGKNRLDKLRGKR